MYSQCWLHNTPYKATHLLSRGRDKQPLGSKPTCYILHTKGADHKEFLLLKNNMNVYLDIDGVILTKRDMKPPPHLKDFLEYITNHFDVYWLTAHCKGDVFCTLTYLKRNLPEPLVALLGNIKATTWDSLKTEAIDFSKDFLWFDDYYLPREYRILKERGKASSLVKIDLQRNPHQLLEITNWLKGKETQKREITWLTLIKVWLNTNLKGNPPNSVP